MTYFQLPSGWPRSAVVPRTRLTNVAHEGETAHSRPLPRRDSSVPAEPTPIHLTGSRTVTVLPRAVTLHAHDELAFMCSAVLAILEVRDRGQEIIQLNLVDVTVDCDKRTVTGSDLPGA